jgi:lipopolysaccharide export system protein LptA
MARYAMKTALCAALLCLALALPASPAEQTDSTPAGSAEKILVTADRLVGDSRDGYAEFIGKVEAVQGDFVINADRLKIYYRRIDPKTGASQEAVDKIVAQGNVRIRSQNRLAETDRAEYSVKDGTLILIGENSTVTDGKNVIKGRKIRLNRADSRISVEGDGTGRVRAVFYPSEKSALTKEPEKSSPPDK